MKEYIVRTEHGADGAVHYFRTGGEIVRCKDCIYWQDQKEGVVEVPICKYDCRGNRMGVVIVMGADDYCSHGERKTAESE